MPRKEELPVIVDSTKCDKIELSVAKRQLQTVEHYITPMKNHANDHINDHNRMIYFYRNFETKFALEKGDVYLFNFDFEVGNELNRAHYCAVLLNSSPRNQLVTIVPLHSLKPNERELNPASEVLLGKIEGLDNGKVSIALINQTRSVDKRRLFDKPTIKNIGRAKRGSNVKEFIAQRKVKYRLSEEQIRILSRAVKNYFTNGYIIHEK